MDTQNHESAPFKRLAHVLIDDLPADARWQELIDEARFQIELEEAVREAESAFQKPKASNT